ncbi:MAG: ABC transporter ATP-binding protein [Clostridia bacterium]|nr:ABC transporter ATP-binding protein [Clostridia bacterium]
MFKEMWKNYKKQIIKTGLGWFITSLMVVTFIAYTIIMIEYAIPSEDINLILVLGISYFGVNILRSITTFFEDFNEDGFQKELQADYREKIYIKLQNIKQKDIDKIKVGEILENIVNDTKEFSKWYGAGICRSYFGGMVRLVGTLFVLAYLNVSIVTITFFIYLLGFFITHIFNKKSIKYTKLKREVNAKILNWSNEQVQGCFTIKSLEVEGIRIKELKELILQYEKATNKLEKNIRIYNCLYDFIVSFVGVINILIGSISVEQGLMTYGIIVILSRYVSSPETYAKWVIQGFQYRNVGKIAYEKINSILQLEEEDIDIGFELNHVESVEFDDVCFSYDNEKNALSNISFEVSRNQSIALIGRTGSGKTSLVNLLCRFYELNNGIIKINGKDYKEYSIRSLRNKIGYIMQKVVIFDATVLENINYANKDVSKDRIIEVCKKLNLHDKIMSLKDGYETKITSDTDIFSAGEKQLLNFTRVMVEDPEIIILDEATASLSYKSEILVRKAIEEITRGKISFIIAHRLSTIKNCDKILLMKNGEIIEAGSHDELMEKKGEYFDLITV